MGTFSLSELSLPLLILIGVGLLGWWVKREQQQQQGATVVAGRTQQGGAPKKKERYSMEEIKKHNKEEDIWIVVKHGKTGEMRVYDVTEYADAHPGGDVIYDSGGKDATEKFNGPQHPPTVHDLIDEYWIGWVDDADGDDADGDDADGDDAERKNK